MRYGGKKRLGAKTVWRHSGRLLDRYAGDARTNQYSPSCSVLLKRAGKSPVR